MTGQPLRAVTDSDRPVKLSITEAADAGEVRALLVALQARVATAVQDPGTPARDLAALSKRLMEIAHEIKALDIETEEAEAAQNVSVDTRFDAAAI